MDKYTAMVDWLRGCPAMAGVLNFQAGKAKADTMQITTEGGDVQQSRKYIDGSEERSFNFVVAFYKPVLGNPYRPNTENHNITALLDVRALMDWIREQEQAHNYPAFPDGCVVDTVQTTHDEPVLAWVDTVNYSPPVAKYTVTIRATYMDYSRTI